MRTNLARSALIVCLPLLVLAQASAPAPEKTTLTDDDYAIYAAALQSLYQKDKVDRIVLIDQTGGGVPPGMAGMTQFGERAQEFYKGIPDQLREALRSRNKATADVDRGKIDIKVEVVTLSYEEAGKMVKGGWGTFEERYSRCPGITLLALPALNAQKDEALLYIGNSCGMLCGEGKLLLMMKKDGHWSVKKDATVWVS
jgi:hypothetical protein